MEYTLSVNGFKGEAGAIVVDDSRGFMKPPFALYAGVRRHLHFYQMFASLESMSEAVLFVLPLRSRRIEAFLYIGTLSVTLYFAVVSWCFIKKHLILLSLSLSLSPSLVGRRTQHIL